MNQSDQNMEVQEPSFQNTKIKEEVDPEPNTRSNPQVPLPIKTEMDDDTTNNGTSSYSPFRSDELHIKIENDLDKGIESESLPQENPNLLNEDIHTTVENILIEFKTEIECNKNNTDIVRIESSIQERGQSTVLNENAIKEETECDESGYDCSNYENSMDSEDIEALRNVEACLSDDDMNIKSEPMNENKIKSEVEHSVLPNYTQTNSFLSIDNRKDNSKHMQIIPETTDDLHDSYNDEEILPTPSESSLDVDSGFQLNSITGNVLSLEHLIATKSTSKTLTQHMCTKCPKVYNSKRSLSRHLKVHTVIEKRVNGIRNGKQTRMENKQKLKKVEEQKHVQKVKKKEEDDDKKEYYKCSCGSKFKRRTLMEACLKSHEDYIERSRYHCITCNKVFSDRILLEVHRKKLHRKRFPCKFCPTDYGNHKQLLNHLQLHHKVQAVEYKIMCKVIKKGLKLKCVLCLNDFPDMSTFKSHVTKHEEPFKCPQCKNTCPNMTEFSSHTKSYHPEGYNDLFLQMLAALMELKKSWICDICDERFLEAAKLGWHKADEHSPELKSDLQVQCEDCHRVFLNQKALTSHMRVHHSGNTVKEDEEQEQAFICLECRKVCQDQNSLDSHMRFHDPERKYPCKFCDFRFASIEKRKKHAEVHTGAMKYVCFICEYQCSSERRLNEHKKSIKHLNVKQYLVTGIPLIDAPEKKEKVSKKKKKKSKDGKDIPCDICGDKFDTIDEMLEHKQAHPFIEFPNDDKPSRIFFK